MTQQNPAWLWTGTQWVMPIGTKGDTGPAGPTGPQGPVGATVYAQDTMPADTTVGAMWLDTTTGRTYVRYDSTWVEVGAQASAPILHAITAKTGNYTATLADEILTVSAASAAVTITLPTAVGITGKQYLVKKTDATTNTVTVDGNGSETIDGQTTAVLTRQYEAVTVVSTGTAWLIV